FLHIFYAWIRNCTLIMRSRAERAASRAPGVFRGAGPSVKLPPVQRRPKKAFRILPQGRTWGNEQGRGGNGPTIEQVARGSERRGLSGACHRGRMAVHGRRRARRGTGEDG